MLRAYAIGQGASTQAFLGISWIVVAGTEPLGPLRDGLMVFAWVLNLLVADFVTGKFLTRKALRETCDQPLQLVTAKRRFCQRRGLI